MMVATSHRESIRTSRSRLSVALAIALSVLFSGCANPASRNRTSVSQNVEARFGAGISVPPKACSPGRVLVPDGLADGRPISEEQAVVLALWNNALFNESLVELDLTRADLITAGLLPNPEFVYFWPEVGKPFKYLVDFPIESLWLRPIRVKATAAENERASSRLTQLALDLIRDTRQSHADLRLAQDRVGVAERAVTLRKRILDLAEARLKAGDASALEVSTARIDSLRADQELIRSKYDVTTAGERLRNLTGLSQYTFDLIPDNTPFEPRADFPVDDLVAEAIHTRPDAIAAEQAVHAAAERLRIARIGWVRFLGLLDATSGKRTGHEFGPAARMTVPIFNHNQGGIARSNAELEQLERRQRTVHDLIVMDVRTAFARYQQARAEIDFLRAKTQPEVEAVIRRTETAYKEGNVTFVIVLETQRQLIDTLARDALLRAELRRAWAELERSVGRRLIPTAPEAPR